jgi:hypothetical protein
VRGGLIRALFVSVSLSLSLSLSQSDCHALLSWLDTALAGVCPPANELIVVQHVRSFRAILQHVEEFKSYVAPWLQAIEEEQRAVTYAAASSSLASSSVIPPVVAPMSPLFSSIQLGHLKGCIRQGKKIGINFPELTMLKRRYDQARQKKGNERTETSNNGVREGTTATGMGTTDAIPLVHSSTALSAPPAHASLPVHSGVGSTKLSGVREMIEIE